MIPRKPVERIGLVGSRRLPFWHRLIAAIILVLYAPGTVLAAMPLVICTANDGHQKIEWCSGDICHGKELRHDHNAALDLDAAAAWHSHDHGCDDRAIFVTQTSRPRLAQLAAAPDESSVDKTCATQALPQYPGTGNPTFRTLAISSQHLAHLRTVLLLI